MQFTCIKFVKTKLQPNVNTFAAGSIQVVHAKTAGSHMTLRGNFSGLVNATDPIKSSKDKASLVVRTRKYFLVGGADFL